MKPSIKRRKIGSGEFDDSISPLLQRIFAARGVASSEELDCSVGELIRSDALLGIEAAVSLLHVALVNQQKILIVGDFDADGATSCAVAVRGLTAMGAVKVEYLVPNRFEYGYGLTEEIVALAQERQPDLIITVDNGTSSIAGVAAARRAGVSVLITDHHLPGAKLPDANAIVNPNLEGDDFPSKALAGVGVIFYVLLALRAKLREVNWFEERNLVVPNLAELLDLVALGTIADVVPLDRNNRVLTTQGLRRIRAGKTVPGIQALIQVAGANQKKLSSTDIGFLIGPRLNAAGRLADMSLGIECLISDDPAHCANLAEQLNKLNIERREIEGEMKRQAMEYVDQISLSEETLPAGIALFDPDWHQGVVGIVASRIKDRCHRPVIAFAKDGDGGLKGSGRSIPGLHLRDLLDLIATRHPKLLSKFGGHAMAAGLTIAESAFDEFVDRFGETATECIDSAMLEKVLETDGELEESNITIETAEVLRIAAPWGQAFPAPCFDNNFDISSRRIVGENHVKLKLRIEGGSRDIDAIAFNALDQPWAAASERIHAVYRLETNEYRGVVSVQLLIEFAEAI